MKHKLCAQTRAAKYALFSSKLIFFLPFCIQRIQEIEISIFVAQGMTYPSIHAIWARWAPPLERSRLAAVAFSGSYVGTVIALPLSGLLAENCGWEWIFYFFGAIGLIWCAAWAWVVKDSPEEDRNITDRYPVSLQ